MNSTNFYQDIKTRIQKFPTDIRNVEHTAVKDKKIALEIFKDSLYKDLVATCKTAETATAKIWLNKLKEKIMEIYETMEKKDMAINSRYHYEKLSEIESQQKYELDSIAKEYWFIGESTEKLPELESENYKIDKDMSIEQKLQNWRKWIIQSHSLDHTDYIQKDITPWEKNPKKKAYVWEAVRSFPLDNPLNWEQKFNLAAIRKLWLVDKMPKDLEELEKIIGWNYLMFMQKNFPKYTGSVSFWPWLKKASYYLGGQHEYLLLWNGDTILLGNFNICSTHRYPSDWWAVRLLKQK